MIITPLEIPDILLIQPGFHEDERGFFLETYREEAYSAVSIGPRFVQDNHSNSKLGTLRGMHYQIKQAQGKLLSVVRGSIYDVCVDLRASSPTFTQWVGIELNDDHHEQLWIPPGFAHGFYVLSPIADVTYKVTNYYSREFERVLHWKDPTINIHWPLIDNQPPLLSPKDAEGKWLNEVEKFP